LVCVRHCDVGVLCGRCSSPLLAMISALFFFLFMRRPPMSTLFPTRRSSDLPGRARWTGPPAPSGSAISVITTACSRWPPRAGRRSEEHTSELQSRENLVCRLLLEKKKGQIGSMLNPEYTSLLVTTLATVSAY